MDLLKRHFSLTLLVTVLFAQVVALAYQVRRPSEHGPVRLIRVWSISLVTPMERAIVHLQDWVEDTWSGYFYLRNVRRENDRLQEENLRLRLEQIRLSQDASQAQRLQALMRFKEEFISETVPAQVIGSSGSEQSRVIYIDKGSNDGLKPDMAVITPTGVVGKIIRVMPETSQVLEINDQSSGVGAIFEKSRLQGILKGMPAGETMVHYIMADEKVEKWERVLTSGGDHIFPKGMPIGYVKQINPGSDGFLNIWIQPTANLNRLEEVLVITRVTEQERELIPEMPMRAADILAQRLPTIQPKVVEPPAVPGQAGAGAPGQPAAAQATSNTPTGTKPAIAKPAATTTKPGTTTTPASVKPRSTTQSTTTPPATAVKPRNAAAAPAATPGKDKNQ
jgi:rod shape-determining protein MreC